MYRRVEQDAPRRTGKHAEEGHDLGVVTGAVSLAAGAASLGSVFPSLSHHLLLVSLAGLVILTAVNMFGISESARLLIVPGAVFLLSMFATIVVGALRSHPVATIGTP